MVDRDTIEAHGEGIRAIAESHGARNVRLFGSLARGTGGPRSDVDLLIDLDSGRSLLDIVAIKQDIEDLLGCPVDVVTSASLSAYIRDDVVREAVPV